MKSRRVLKPVILIVSILLAACGPAGAVSTPARQNLTPIPPMLTVIPQPPTEITPGPTLTNLLTPPVTGRFEEFTGSVQIEAGQCCIGGVAGETIQARVDLSASSPFGKVEWMKVARNPGCLPENGIETAAWEPFADSKIVPVPVALNWVGFYVSAQFQDEWGNLSPVYCDDISVEGFPPVPSVDPDWISGVQCFSAQEVHPGPGELIHTASVTFSWPGENDLPEGVFYRVFAYGAADNYTALVAGGMTRENSLTLPLAAERAGDVVWYVTLVDAVGVLLDHGRCSSFPASLLTVDPPEGIKGIHFLYQP